MQTFVIQTPPHHTPKTRKGRYIALNFNVNTMAPALQRISEKACEKFLTDPSSYNIPDGDLGKFVSRMDDIQCFVKAELEKERPAMIRTLHQEIRKRKVQKSDPTLFREVIAQLDFNIILLREDLIRSWQIHAIALYFQHMFERDLPPLQRLRKKPQRSYERFTHEDAIRYAVFLHDHFKTLLEGGVLRPNDLYFPITSLINARDRFMRLENITMQRLEYMTRRFLVFDTMQQRDPQDAENPQTIPHSAVDMVRETGNPYGSHSMLLCAEEHVLNTYMYFMTRLYKANKEIPLFKDQLNVQRALREQLVDIIHVLPEPCVIREFATRLRVFIHAETTDYLTRIAFDQTQGADIENTCSLLDNIVSTYEYLYFMLRGSAVNDEVIVDALKEVTAREKEQRVTVK